ncbi:hypothetical protein [Sedimentibacter saalensis]|uniref:hypothetical protein n=1 Tax=Sedimentibacter saalensis TaxID=130788 RepID=UPI00289CC77D|nr:hypothetical protein [Sedimentibacter saalensis]
MYFNVKIWCKLNIASSFVCMNIYMILFKKKHYIYKKVFYSVFAEKILSSYKRTKSVKKVKAHFDYIHYVRKYARRIMKAFIIKNISLYPEIRDDSSTFALEFVVVNNILKKSLLNE